MVENGAEVNCWDDNCPGSALSVAIEAGHDDVIRFLVENGADAMHGESLSAISKIMRRPQVVLVSTPEMSVEDRFLDISG